MLINLLINIKLIVTFEDHCHISRQNNLRFVNKLCLSNKDY